MTSDVPAGYLNDVFEFHLKFGLIKSIRRPHLLDPELVRFRFKRLVSEAEEYRDAALKYDPQDRADYTNALAEVLDALVDSVYIALGNVVMHGLTEEFDEAWRRVHEANMAKERVSRVEASKFGSMYDVIKPPGWEPPDHSDLVEDNEWQA